MAKHFKSNNQEQNLNVWMKKNKIIKSEDIGNIDLISKKLKLDSNIKSFTEKNRYYHEGQPKIFEPINKEIDPNKPVAVELFSGLGGTSMGFEMSGFQTILGVDIHSPSIETFRRSHPAATAILGDITKLVKLESDNSKNLISQELKKRIGDQGPDVLIAGIPCQGFSRSNKKRNHLDARNYLFLYFVEMVKTLKPKTIMIENVSGLKTLKNGEFVKHIIKALEEIGYSTHYKMLNAADYGVPQRRNRLIFLGSRIKEKIPFPKPKYSWNNHLTVNDAISDLPSLSNKESSENYKCEPKNEFQKLMRGNQQILFDHLAPSHPDEVVNRIKATEPGQPMYPKFKQRIRLSWNMPSPTQVSGGIRPQFQFGHPEDARGLSIRERCRTQSIPDHVKIFGGTVQGRVQTGNAVPPLLAKSISEEILKHLQKVH